MTQECDGPGSNSAHAQAGIWFDAFADSAAFECLTRCQQADAGAIIHHLTEYSFFHLELSPEDWTVHSVRECCLEVMPRKITAKPEFFAAIAPVLGAFFRFLGDQQLQARGHAIATAIDKIADAIPTLAKDSRSWGPAKQLAMAAMEAGVDLSNQSALNRYIAEYNAKIASQLESRAPAPPSNPYEPCPCGSGKKYKFCCKPA